MRVEHVFMSTLVFSNCEPVTVSGTNVFVSTDSALRQYFDHFVDLCLSLVVLQMSTYLEKFWKEV